MAKLWTAIFIISCLILVVLLRFGALFLLLALLPAVIALFIDHSPKKQVFNTVFAANLAGTLGPMIPMITTMLQGGDYDITPLMTNPRVWLVIYASAAAGWALVFTCHWIARLIVAVSYTYRATALEERQRALVTEWGEEIANGMK